MIFHDNPEILALAEAAQNAILRLCNHPNRTDCKECVRRMAVAKKLRAALKKVCDHSGYSFKKHGRVCPCGEVMRVIPD